MRPLPSSLARPVLRRQWNRLNSTRFASTNTNSNVQSAQQKAQDTLASAQKTAGRLFESSKKFLGPAGDAVTRLLGCVCFLYPRFSINTSYSAYRQPLLYNLSVAREFVKKVYIAEGLQPPTSIETIRSAYQTLWSRAINAAYWRGIINSGEILQVGVYGLQAYGIFKVSNNIVLDLYVDQLIS